MSAAGYITDADVMHADLAFMTRRWGELARPCKFELRALGEGKDADWEQFVPARIPDAIKWADARNRQGYNIYVVRNPISIEFRGSADDSSIVAAFLCWADCDDQAATENVRRFDGPRWSMAITTGRTPWTRVHLYWELAKPCGDLNAWRQLQVNIATHFKSDITVVNPSRIMRLGGTVSFPASQKRTRGYVEEGITIRTEYEDKREPVEFERMLRVFGASATDRPQPGAFGIHIDTGPQPLDRDHMTIQALSGQEWHDAVVRLVASYVAKGLSDAEIHTLTDPLTLAGYTVEQTRREVQTAINGARAKGYAPEQEEPYADPDDIDFDAKPDPEPDADPPPSDLEWYDDIQPVLTDGYLVKGVLSAGAMSVVYGPSNSGKTFFALDLAFHIATKTPWQNRRVAGAAVLYLAAEGGRGVANRIAAIKAETGCVDVPLALRRAGLDLLKSNADLKHIVELVREVTSRWPDMQVLIVIDTLSRIMAGGDENSAADMTALIRNIDAVRSHTGAHIMLVHHTGKDAARGARGHSSLRAATDTEIEVMNEDGARAAQVQKQRDYEGNETFAFSLKSISLGFDQDGDEVQSCVVEWQDAADFTEKRDRTKGIGGNQKLIAETFDQMISEGLGKPNLGGVGMPEPGQFWTVDAEELRRISRGKMVATDTRSAFNQAMKALIEDRGLFVSGGNVFWRVDRRINK